MSDAVPGEPVRAVRGVRVDASDADRLEAALAAALDYRGDVTVERHGDEADVTGYLFDAGTALHLLPADGGAAMTIAFTEVAAVTFTGRDTAEGKSFETWVRKFAEKKGLVP